MKKEKIILIGSGGHALIVADIIESSTNYQIIGVVTKDSNIKEFRGYPILGNDDVLDYYKQNGIKNIAFGIGAYKTNDFRELVFNSLKAKGFNIVTLIHKSAIICSNVEIGEGCIVFPGVIVNTSAKIGNNVIIATSSSIDHETILEDHVLISAGVTIGAYSKIKRKTIIALGAKVISGIEIGEDVLIGAGSVVVKDCKEPGIYLGIPAKKIK
jgi:sugar O-acyltransferase (sialic acid O-acetyltransferase NeuD family)